MLENLTFGTYGAHTSKGIYQAVFDSATGTISNVHLSAEIGAPTYLAGTDGFLYVVNQTGSQGGITTFKNDGSALKQLATDQRFASAPVNVNIDANRRFLFASNYNDGRLQIFQITATGQLKLADELQNHGHGPLPQQTSSHIHYADITPNGNLILTDLGTDELITFAITDTGQISDKLSTFQTRPGFGPKKILFNTTGTYAYVLGELANMLAVLKYDASTNTFTQTQLWRTIPDSWTKTSAAGGMHMSADGRFIYVSNRGHNSITVFEVSKAGDHVIAIQTIDSEGNFPRDFCLDSTGEYVLVGNHRSDNVTIFHRDQKSGRLNLISSDAHIPEVVCIFCQPQL